MEYGVQNGFVRECSTLDNSRPASTWRMVYKISWSGNAVRCTTAGPSAHRVWLKLLVLALGPGMCPPVVNLRLTAPINTNNSKHLLIWKFGTGIKQKKFKRLKLVKLIMLLILKVRSLTTITEGDFYVAIVNKDTNPTHINKRNVENRCAFEAMSLLLQHLHLSKQ